VGKFVASALAFNSTLTNITNNKNITIAELEKRYHPKELCDELNDVIETIRTNKELNYDEIIMLEDELNKRKKQYLEENPHLKINKNRMNSSKADANINYTQRKISNRFYWYKQFTIDGKKSTQYIKDIKKEKIDISKSTITFHPDFSLEKK
jgi:hypothetical protein